MLWLHDDHLVTADALAGGPGVAGPVPRRCWTVTTPSPPSTRCAASTATPEGEPRDPAGAATEEAVARPAHAPRGTGCCGTPSTAWCAGRRAARSPGHAAVRTGQAGNTALPTYHAITRILVARLAALPQDTGI